LHCDDLYQLQEVKVKVLSERCIDEEVISSCELKYLIVLSQIYRPWNCSAFQCPKFLMLRKWLKPDHPRTDLGRTTCGDSKS